MRTAVFSLLLFLLTALPASAQHAEEYDMGILHTILLYGDVPAENLAASLDPLLASGAVSLWGATPGTDSLRAVVVVPTDSLAEAEQIAQGLETGTGIRAEIVPWYVARNLIRPVQPPFEPAEYVFGILVRGPSWTAEQTEETQRIQEGHMANINRLAQEGTLVLAGPFVEGGDRRGIFIFKVDSLEEAQRLTDTDPAVASGRLKILLYRWLVPQGILP